MTGEALKIEKVTVKPNGIFLFVPPIVWKGDRVGHIGQNNTFFWVLEGECFLSIDGKSSIVKKGQLAFLPKGKHRAYTRVSERFIMYEMRFSARSDGQDIMEILGLCDGDYAVDIENVSEMSGLFESSCHEEMFRNPLYDVTFCSNIMRVISIYAAQRHKMMKNTGTNFRPVLDFMSKNLERVIKTEELAAVAFMQTTYFIRCFRKIFGLPPQGYLAKLRVSRAMELLISTVLPIEQISRSVGFRDVSYFSRVFKSHCGVTPSEYRKAFRE